MKVKRQWHAPELLAPVSGEHVHIWMRHGIETLGFGDAPDGLVYRADAVYFENAEALRVIHPLIELSADTPEGIGLFAVSDTFLTIDEVEYWHPGLPVPGTEIPEGEVSCAGCGSTMRRVPKSEGVFKCTRCPRQIKCTFEVTADA